MNKNDTTVEISVNGKPVKQFNHNGQIYIEARDGTEYTIKLSNNTLFQRKMAIVTIDGINVISGLPHSENEIGQGYIVPSMGTIEIKGFRKDMSTVGAFKFCKKGSSYCNLKGLAGNNGVIGVRFYDEKANPITWSYSSETFKNEEYAPYRVSPSTMGPEFGYGFNDNTSIGSNSLGTEQNTCQTKGLDIKKKAKKYAYKTSEQAAPDFDLGTTWGKKIDDTVTTVQFTPDMNSVNDVIIYYDSRANLEKIGISFKKEKQVFFPKAFGSFAEPPKGWNG